MNPHLTFKCIIELLPNFLHKKRPVMRTGLLINAMDSNLSDSHNPSSTESIEIRIITTTSTNAKSRVERINKAKSVNSVLMGNIHTLSKCNIVGYYSEIKD